MRCQKQPEVYRPFSAKPFSQRIGESVLYATAVDLVDSPQGFAHLRDRFSCRRSRSGNRRLIESVACYAGPAFLTLLVEFGRSLFAMVCVVVYRDRPG